MINQPVKEKGISIVCPHCKFGSRYDSSYVEDAIKICHEIVCVVCGGSFKLVRELVLDEEKQVKHE